MSPGRAPLATLLPEGACTQGVSSEAWSSALRVLCKNSGGRGDCQKNSEETGLSKVYKRYINSTEDEDFLKVQE